MADESAGESYEIQIDTVGAEAVQQTLDALGASAGAIGGEGEASAATGGDGAASSPTNATAVQQTLDALGASAGAVDGEREGGNAGEPPVVPTLDFSGLMDVVGRGNAILERILAAAENPPTPYQPTY